MVVAGYSSQSRPTARSSGSKLRCSRVVPRAVLSYAKKRTHYRSAWLPAHSARYAAAGAGVSAASHRDARRSFAASPRAASRGHRGARLRARQHIRAAVRWWPCDNKKSHRNGTTAAGNAAASIIERLELVGAAQRNPWQFARLRCARLPRSRSIGSAAACIQFRSSAAAKEAAAAAAGATRAARRLFRFAQRHAKNKRRRQ